MTATPRMVDWTRWTSWIEQEWPEPHTGADVARQTAIRTRRAQGLGPKVSDPAVLHQLRVMMRRRRSI